MKRYNTRRKLKDIGSLIQVRLRMFLKPPPPQKIAPPPPPIELLFLVIVAAAFDLLLFGLLNSYTCGISDYSDTDERASLGKEKRTVS